MAHIKSFRSTTAVSVVIANMVGTGIFTSLGFQLLEIQSGFVILMLWLVGGLTALCGALTYAELGASLPRSGGEYNFISQIYHPGAGFVSGWISATIGFAAPGALVAITFGTYLASVFPTVNVSMAAAMLVILLTIVHCSSHKNSSSIQFSFTFIKLVLICLFCAGALIFVEHPADINFLPDPGDGELLIGGAFAVSLIYVNYAYTGWNAATYLIDELDDPKRRLPGILISGAVIVIIVYLALNYTFLSVAPVESMKGKIEIGYIAANFAFGSSAAKFMGIILAILLVSTVSAMILAGPRVLQVIGQDYRAFALLGRTSSDGIPFIAILFQCVLTLIFIGTASFESILVFSGFVLSLNTLFTVFGVFILRWRNPRRHRPYSTYLYPLPPLIYIAITLWTLIYVLVQRPEEGVAGIGLILVGLVAYLISIKAGGGSDRKV